MKKIILGLSSLLLCGFALVGCTDTPNVPNDPDNSGENGDNQGGNQGGNQDEFDLNAEIQVYSRDTSSGTRDGFFTALGREDMKGDDKLLAEGTSIVAGNGDMINSIKNDKYGIGYASLASVEENADSVKGLTFNGVEASAKTVIDGSYKLSRNFNYIISTHLNENEEVMVNAFLAYMNSKEGLGIIASEDGILEKNINDAMSWQELTTSNEDVKQALALSEQGTKVSINLGGSTSVEGIAEALTSSFSSLVKGFVANHNHTGSGDAYKNTQGSGAEGTSALQIGFLSREIELDGDEKAAEGTYGRICKDGIVAVINPANTTLTDASAALLLAIFDGTLTTWNAVKNYEGPLTGDIQVYSRDTTSGTRDGFFTALGESSLKGDDEALAEGVSIVASNGDMINSIKNDKYGIGYASLASVEENADSVKGLTFNGVEASAKTVIDGSYKLSRNFNYIISTHLNENEEVMVNAFLAYMNSKEGLGIIASEDGILEKNINDAMSWQELTTSNEDVKQALALSEQGTKVSINLGGSTSVEGIAEALTSSFSSLVKGFVANHNHTGSGDAYKNTQGSGAEGTSALQIGFLSREIELDGDEKAAEGTYGRICKDGIVCIVNPKNNVLSDADADLLLAIFKGEITKWEDVK